MNPKRKRQLLALVFVLCILAIAAGLILYALRQNISLFYTPTQIVNHEASPGRLIRVGGMVVKGSVQRSDKTLEVRFKLSDFQHELEVITASILPDLFREGQGVIAKGYLSAQGVFMAEEVLAKHDENYMPPELKASLKPNNESKP